MTSFTSGKRAELGLPNANHDKKPWHELETDDRYTDAEYDEGNRNSRCWYGLAHAPRPEFDVPENPILVAFRHDLSGYYTFTSADVSGVWLGDWDHVCMEFAQTPEQIEHARRVLSKLAALS